MSQKPSLPKGTRDFGPKIMARRKFIIEHIAATFKKYGFLPLETPAMENLSTLSGKYGDEGDQLLFKVLDSGEFLKKVSNNDGRHRFMRGLQASLKNLCHLIFKELDQNDTRQWALIKEVIESEKIDQIFFGVALDSYDRHLIRDFIRQENVIISIDLSMFFNNSLIYKNNELRSKIDHHFEQFIDNKIIPTYSKILDNFYISNIGSKKLATVIAEKGLRYDLTVPFARFVAMNRNEISFPFKRYQIQPVWRADRPQKGRYREFYQCDADVVGTNSLLCELEIVLMIKEVFQKIGLSDYTIKINHRGILFGLAEALGALGKERMLFTAIDKLDKMEEAQVKKELEEAGFSVTQTTKLFNILNHAAGNEEKLAFLEQEIGKTEQGAKGIKELNEILSLLATSGSDDANLMIDAALARGLSYYTGTIFELKVNNVKIGSVGGGGRYDDLTGIFGLPDVSGVGFSFGIDRIYDVLDELNLFPQEAEQTSKVLITHFDEASFKYGLKVLQQIRDVGIASEIYPDISKIKKQMEYANKKQIPYAIIIGDEEIKTGKLAIKNMLSGEQNSLSIDQILETLQT